MSNPINRNRLLLLFTNIFHNGSRVSSFFASKNVYNSSRTLTRSYKLNRLATPSYYSKVRIDPRRLFPLQDRSESRKDTLSLSLSPRDCIISGNACLVRAENMSRCNELFFTCQATGQKIIFSHLVYAPGIATVWAFMQRYSITS